MTGWSWPTSLAVAGGFGALLCLWRIETLLRELLEQVQAIRYRNYAPTFDQLSEDMGKISEAVEDIRIRQKDMSRIRGIDASM